MSTPDQWEVAGALGAVTIFAATVALNVQAFRGFFRWPRWTAPEPCPDATALVEATRELVSATRPMAMHTGKTAPEAEAPIEATGELIKAMQVLAERSDSRAGVHKRLDGMNDDIGKLGQRLLEVRRELNAINRTLHLINEHLIKQ